MPSRPTVAGRCRRRHWSARQAIQTQLKNWNAEAVEHVAVCVDSVTMLLLDNSVKSIFQFFHLLGSYLSRAGVALYAHLDPADHDDATKRILAGAFDDARVWDGNRLVARAD